MHYILTDSSPQLGIIILVTIEDVFVMPSPSMVSLMSSFDDLNLQDQFESRYELMSSTTKGKAGLVKSHQISSTYFSCAVGPTLGSTSCSASTVAP